MHTSDTVKYDISHEHETTVYARFGFLASLAFFLSSSFCAFAFAIAFAAFAFFLSFSFSAFAFLASTNLFFLSVRRFRF